MNRSELARLIDHACLLPGATAVDVEGACAEAVRYGFHGVCVAPSRVAQAAAAVAGHGVRVCAVVGFPHGGTLTKVKSLEARSTLEVGADEIDMVAQIGAIKEGNDHAVATDIARVAEVVRSRPGALLKVILETSLLTEEEIVRACRIAADVGADFVKTSTGFGGAGAAVETVRLMRATVGDALGVKAAGGIRDYAAAKAMIEAGATRIGTSASVAIVASAPAS